MAIQNRRGNDADFQPTRLLPGEFAVTMDLTKLYICFTSGTVKQIALTEDLLAEISSLSTTLAGQISDLTDGASAQLQRIISLEGRASSAESAISSHNTRITALEGDNASNKTRLTNAEGTLVNHELRLDDFITSMVAAEANIRDLSAAAQADAGDISGLKTRMTAAETNIGNLSTIDPVWTFEVNNAGHLIITQERYDPSGVRFSMNEGRLMVTYA